MSGKHTIVELLKSPLLSLWNPEEDHDESEDVESSIQAESAKNAESLQDGGKRDRQDTGPEQAGRDGPCHADLTMRQRKDFGGVGKRHRALTGRVEGAENVDEQGDEAEMNVACARNQGTQTGGKEGPGHLDTALLVTNHWHEIQKILLTLGKVKRSRERRPKVSMVH